MLGKNTDFYEYFVILDVYLQVFSIQVIQKQKNLFVKKEYSVKQLNSV